MRYHTIVTGPAGVDQVPPEIALVGIDGKVSTLGRPEYADRLDQAVEMAITTCTQDPVQLVGNWAPGAHELAECQHNGWQINGTDQTGWYRLTRLDRVLLLGRLDEIIPGNTPLFAPHWDARDIAEQLASYRSLVGVPWWGTAGVAGCALLRQLRQRMTPLWRWDDHPTELAHAYSGELRWYNPSSAGWISGPAQSVPARWVHKFDIRGSYLSAAGQTRLPLDRLQRTGNLRFDPTRPGYWQVAVTDEWRALLLGEAVREHPPGPPLANPTRIGAGHGTTGEGGPWVWLTTPVMTYLWDTEDTTPEVLDSWTAEQGGRLLYGWYERLREARMTAERQALGTTPELLALTDHLLDALKRTYTETVGMLGKAGGSVYRPDWRHLIVDTARVALHRKIDRMWWETGQWPLRIWVDAVEYASTEQDPAALGQLLGAGDKFGQFRHAGTTPLTEWETANRPAPATRAVGVATI